MPDVRLRLEQKQAEFVFDWSSRYLLAYGGRGSMKTTSVAAKAAMRASFPGAREGLYRRKLVDLKRTTLVTLLEGNAATPPILPAGSYTHNQQKNEISIVGGGKIVYGGFESGEVSRQGGATGSQSSENLTGAGIDEWVQVTEQHFDLLDPAVRVPHAKLPNQIYGACNPGAPSHYLARRFGLALDHVCKDGYRAWHMDPRDNPHLPPVSIRVLENLEGVARARFLEGKWVGSDGLVSHPWDRMVHCVEQSCTPDQVILAVDDGWTDPFVCLRIEIDYDRRMHVSAEEYWSPSKTGRNRDDKIAAVKALGGMDANYVVYDSAASELGDAFRQAGLPAIPVVKRSSGDWIMQTVQMVSQRLAVAGDGRPRLTVDPTCVATVAEFETYEMDTRTDKPFDRDNHALDALRYAVCTFDGGPKPLFEAIGSYEGELDENGRDTRTWAQWRAENPDAGWSDA